MKNYIKLISHYNAKLTFEIILNITKIRTKPKYMDRVRDVFVEKLALVFFFSNFQQQIRNQQIIIRLLLKRGKKLKICSVSKTNDYVFVLTKLKVRR